MRPMLAVLLLLPAFAAPALANGQMHQSPLMAHKAGAACAPGHRRTQGDPVYRMAGCVQGRR